MTHIEEYQKDGTIHGWKEGETDDEFIALLFEDAKGNTNIEEKITIAIDSLLKYNNVTHITMDEVMEAAAGITTIVKNNIFRLHH